MSAIPVVSIVSEAHAQYGGFVEINESDFDAKVHTIFGESEGSKKATVAELKEALAAKGIEIPEGAKKADLQSLLDAAE